MNAHDRSAAIMAQVAAVGRKPPRSINAADLQGHRFAPVRYIVPDLIPDGLTLFGGKPKLGKSWLMLGVAIAVAYGGFTLGDRKCVEGDVLYAALEDNERRLQSRMEKVWTSSGAWSPRLTFWTEMSRLEDGGLEELREWIMAQPNPRLVIIDTFAKVRSARRKEEGIYEGDYRSAAPLKALADETGVGIVIVHHLRKAAADEDPLDAISGSTGLTGAVDTILVLNRSGDGVTLYGRGRDIAEIESAVSFDRETCRWSVLGDAEEVQRSNQRRAILEALRLAPDPLTAADVRDVTGLSFAAARRLLAAMATKGEISRPERGKYASL